jgi:hypothetical protein
MCGVALSSEPPKFRASARTSRTPQTPLSMSRARVGARAERDVTP